MRTSPSFEKLRELERQKIIRESLGGGINVPSNIPRTDKAIKKYLKRMKQKVKLLSAEKDISSL